jgi:hypothetical protein
MLRALQSKCGLAGILAIAALMPTGIQATSLGPLPFKSECTIDGASLPCSPGHSGIASGGFSLWSMSSNSIDLSVFAEAGVSSGFNKSASADVDLTFWATTEGPVRNGLAFLGIYPDGDGGGFGYITRRQHQLESLTSSLLSRSCLERFVTCTGNEIPAGNGLFLFRLGEPFQIQLKAGVEMESIEDSGFGGWSNYPGLRLELWELDGAPVEILGPVTVPEPRPFGAIMLAISAMLILAIRRLGLQ